MDIDNSVVNAGGGDIRGLNDNEKIQFKKYICIYWTLPPVPGTELLKSL